MNKSLNQSISVGPEDGILRKAGESLNTCKPSREKRTVAPPSSIWKHAPSGPPLPQ